MENRQLQLFVETQKGKINSRVLMVKKTSPPIYQQIMDFILNKINTGEWQVHEKIPSEAELGDIFKTSRMTVNRALRELTAAGRLVRKQGNGTFVAALKPQSALLEINSIADDIRKSGGQYSCDVHLLCEEKASPDIAMQMELKPYTNLYHSIIVHKKDAIPLLLADRLINPTVVPDYIKQDFTRISPTEYLLQVAPVDKIQHVVEALIPPAWIRDLLDINVAEPCLALFRRTWTSEQITTKSSFYYPGSRYSLGGTFSTANTGIIQVT